MHTLSYRWAKRQTVFKNWKVYKHGRNYIDFIITGYSLKDILGYSSSDIITMLGWTNYIVDEMSTIEEFLKQIPPKLETGRTIIYGCPECGDFECGAITAEIIEINDKIIWRNFAYENGVESYDV